MILDIFISSFRNLRRKKLRSFLTMLGIIIGVTSVATVLSIGSGGKKAITEEFNRFGLNGLSIRPVASYTGEKGVLMEEEISSIKAKISQVKDVMPVLYYYGNLIQKNIKKECIIWGIGDNAGKTISLTPIYGQNLNSYDLEIGSDNCVIDNNIAKQIFKRENIVGKSINILLNGSMKTFTVKGIINANGSMLSNIAGEYIPAFVYVPYTTLQKIYGVNDFDQVIVNVDKNNNLDLVGQKIVNMLSRSKNLDHAYYADNMVKQKEKIENILGIITAIISAVAAVSLIVGGLGIMTIMLVAVNERTREIGIKKAVGATKGMIIFEFISEALVITLSGGGIGVLLTFIISITVNMLVGFKTELNLSIFLLALIFSVIIGIIFSVYPAKKAADLNPITALRYE